MSQIFSSYFILYNEANVKDLNGIKIHLFTVDIPVNLLYSKDKFFAGAGPDFRFGMSGNYKYSGKKYSLYDSKKNGLSARAVVNLLDDAEYSRIVIS